MGISLVRVVANFYPDIGGSITHVLELSKFMHPYLKKQLIIAPLSKDDVKEFDDSFPVPIKRVNAALISCTKCKKLPLVSSVNLLYYARNIAKEIRTLVKSGYHIDIVQVHYNILGQYLLLFFKGYGISIPLVIMHHGSSIDVGNDTLRAKIVRKASLLMYDRFKPDYYFQLDDGTLNKNFLNELNKRNIDYKILLHAIDTQYFIPREIERSYDDFIVLFNHRLDPFKRADLSIMAFKYLLERLGYPLNIKLRIIGSGPLLEELINLVEINQLNSYVQFLGKKSIDDAKTEIDSADVVIGTSLISNVNRSILEAMACGKPVVVFDSISESNLFINMSNAIVVPAGDVHALAGGIELLYKNPELRIEIGKNARETIIKHRSWEQRISQELSVYDEIKVKQSTRNSYE